MRPASLRCKECEFVSKKNPFQVEPAHARRKRITMPAKIAIGILLSISKRCIVNPSRTSVSSTEYPGNASCLNRVTQRRRFRRQRGLRKRRAVVTSPTMPLSVLLPPASIRPASRHTAFSGFPCFSGLNAWAPLAHSAVGPYPSDRCLNVFGISDGNRSLTVAAR